jgi:hypothetical protein
MSRPELQSSPSKRDVPSELKGIAQRNITGVKIVSTDRPSFNVGPLILYLNFKGNMLFKSQNTVFSGFRQ